MTCIAGWMENDRVIIGGDSAGVAGYNLHLREDPKVFKNGNMIFGYTSSFRMGQLLRFSLSIPKKKEKQEDYEFLCTDFVDAVRKTLKNGGYSEINNNKEWGGSFLIGFNKKLYYMDNDFQIGIPKEPFCACGCGRDYALGAMHSLEGSKKSIPLKNRITIALDAASRFSAGVRPPYNYVEI